MPSHSSSDGSEPAGLTERLLVLSEDPDYTLTQVNGQRVYRKAAHAWSGLEPSRICEVFVGRIPHDCFEDTLVPLFQMAGELFEFRLMINFSGFNRGYGFAMYATPQGAQKAIVLFNNYYIRPNWQLGVCQSVNNCRLHIARIPATFSSEGIVRLLYELTDEVVEVWIRRGRTGSSALVEYRSHRGAAMARKALVAAGQAWGGTAGSRPSVDWSQPTSLQLVSRYREVGRWTPEAGVQIMEVEPSECGGGGVACGWSRAVPPPAPSYTLEPWVRARRLREIETAERAGRASRAELRAALPPPPLPGLPSPPPPALPPPPMATFPLAAVAALWSPQSSCSSRSPQSSNCSPSTSDDDRDRGRLMRAWTPCYPPPPPPPHQWRAASPPPPSRPATGHWVPEPAAPRSATAPPRAPGDYDPWSYHFRFRTD